MLPFVLAVPEIGTLLEGLALSFGGVALYKSLHSEDKIPQMFSSDNSIINVNDMQWADDTKSTRSDIKPVFDFKDYKYEKDVKEKNVDYDVNFVKTKIVDDYLFKKSDVNENDVSIDLSKVVKNVDVPELQGDNLLDTMKSNTQALVAVLSSLNNTISSGVVTNSFVLGAIAKGLNALVSEVSDLKTVLSLIGMNGVSISENLSKLHMDNVDVSSFIEYLKLNGFNIKNENIENSVNSISEVMQNINNSGLGIKNEVIENAMNTVASAKELEKENYEYMKTPKTYILSDEDLPKLAPRDVIALSEAVKAHLNSQEASLTGEEISDFEDDFDLGDVLTKLFNFKGITGDIKNLPKE